jgi:CheY-like chemotaxis protein/HPt (histidine-containing phosphotransfer) domain-containing protein
VLVKPVSASMLFDSTMNVLGASPGEPAESDRPRQPVDPRLAALAGARILLVEDNDINQQVARELLEDAGLVVEVADNGQIAIDLLRKSSYDLVFMDMQMPVMDGIAATRAARQLEGLAHLPIVAMTANAMAQDRRKCMDAGMNDFLVKPIDPQEMLAILARWVRRQPPMARPGPEKPRGQTATPRPVTPVQAFPEGIEGLDTTLGLGRMMGKKTLYLAMLRKYVAGQQSAVMEIRSALAAGDQVTAERIAHTTKAVSATLGAMRVQERAALVETAIRDGRSGPFVEELLDQLDTPLRELLAALARGFSAEAMQEAAHA